MREVIEVGYQAFVSGAVDVKLSAAQIARLDSASAIPMGTPHEQINGSAATIAGGKSELLDLASVRVV